MARMMKRRAFLQTAATGCALGLATPALLAAARSARAPGLISPGCRRSKVRVAKLYLGRPKAHWPTPKMDLKTEVQAYEARLSRMDELSDVDFVVNELVTSPEQLQAVKGKLTDVDGVLAIHLSMGIRGMLNDLVSIGRPTVLFAAPYSGHEWTRFGALQKREGGSMLECMLTSDYSQLAVGVRPFRAIHHLREAKILNVTKRQLPAQYVASVRERLGTEIKRIEREQVLAAYDAVADEDAQAEARRWIARATKVVEPSKEEVVKSCKLALALERLLEDEDATVMTVDCYGTMWRQLPAYPCIGFTRLNDMGLGGICESDLQSAMTHIILQGLSGRPGFVNDPTMDVSTDSIILAHCLGSTRMDGPDKKAAPYKLRCIMERQEGAVAQVKMRRGERATTARLIGTDLLLYFTGTILDAPDLDRGCRTKITVQVDGDAEVLWQNWSHGLHRVTCYGDLAEDLRRFCKFAQIAMVDEAAPAPAEEATA